MRRIAILLFLLAPLACRSKKNEDVQATFTAEEEARFHAIFPI